MTKSHRDYAFCEKCGEAIMGTDTQGVNAAGEPEHVWCPNVDLDPTGE